MYLTVGVRGCCCCSSGCENSPGPLCVCLTLNVRGKGRTTGLLGGGKVLTDEYTCEYMWLPHASPCLMFQPVVHPSRAGSSETGILLREERRSLPVAQSLFLLSLSTRKIFCIQWKELSIRTTSFPRIFSRVSYSLSLFLCMRVVFVVFASTCVFLNIESVTPASDCGWQKVTNKETDVINSCIKNDYPYTGLTIRQVCKKTISMRIKKTMIWMHFSIT